MVAVDVAAFVLVPIAFVLGSFGVVRGYQGDWQGMDGKDGFTPGGEN
jgi:hypothetical protein